MQFLLNIILSRIHVKKYFYNYLFLLIIIALQTKKFRINQKLNGNLLLKQVENLDKKNILYTKKNSLKKIKIKIEHTKNFNRKIDNEIKKLSNGFFLKKYEKLLLKNHKASNKNKSINALNTCIANNSIINLHHKLGSNLYQNLLITDRPLYKKLKNKVKINQNVLTTKIKNSKTMKIRPEINKKLNIECGYFSNEEKYDINEDNYSKRYKNYLSSINSTGSITRPLSLAPLNALNLLNKNLVSFPGKVLEGLTENESLSSNTIPASVVFETMYLKVSRRAYSIKRSYSS